MSNVAIVVQLLGQFQAGDRTLPADKRGCLLAHLAYDGRWLTRDQVAFLFWPDTDEQSARRNLRQLLSRVKSLPSTETVEIEPTRLRWRVDTDIARFRQAVARREWEEAVALYRGELLAGFAADGADGFGAWLELERENLRSTFRQAVLGAAQQLEAAGASLEAAHRLRPLLDGDELAEDALQAYLRNAYLAGQRDLALAAYRQFSDRLLEELGLEPLPETQQLADTISAAAPLRLPARGAARTTAVPLSIRKPPRLVGRDETCHEALAAPGPVVLLAGEAGVGKTRLLEALAPHAPRVSCLEGLQAVPYRPLLTLIQELTDRGVALPDLGAYLPDLARLLPEVAPGVTPGPAEPTTAKARLLEALSRYFEGVCAGGGAFDLAFDDLQWADDGTLELLALLGARGRLRILGAFRRFERTAALDRALSGLSSSGSLNVLDLEPLAEGDLRELLAQLIGSGSGPPAFSRWLHERSGGNPMFALETLRSLFESGTLQSGREGWHTDIDAVTRDYSEIDTPAAIADVVRRRVSHLSAETARTLQAAAVVRAGFTPRLLAQVVGLSEWAVLDALEEAEAGGLVEGDRFRHDLLRQSIYQAVPAVRRRLLHGRVAEALADAGEPLEVAEHWLAAGEAARACELWREAAAQLRDQGLVQEAIAILRRALEHAPEQAVAWSLESLLAGLHANAGDIGAAEALATDILAGCDTPRLRAAALEVISGCYLKQGRLEDAERVAREAIGVARAAGEVRLVQSISAHLASALVYTGRLDEAQAIIEPIVADLRERGPELDYLIQLDNLAVIYDNTGRSEEALPLHLETLAGVKRLGARFRQVDIALNLLACLIDLGRPEEGLAAAEEALQLGSYEATEMLRNNLARALMDLGRYDEAARHFEVQTRESQDPTLLAIAWARLARIYARLGRERELREALEEALSVATRTEYDLGRAAAVISLLTLGTPEQREAAAQLAERIDRNALVASLRAELERALAPA